MLEIMQVNDNFRKLR